MPTNERPGVYSSVEVTAALNAAAAGKVAGLAARTASGTKGECVKVTSYAQAVAAFGADCSMTKLIKILFSNGASAVQAVAAEVGAAPDTDDYTAAFEVLMGKQDVSIMLCDSDAQAVHSAMKTAISGAAEDCKYRIGIVEAGGSVEQACARAQALNYERMVLVYPAETGDGALCGAMAAAMAGVTAAGTDPALPFNGAALAEVSTENRFTDTQITQLVQAGVTPVEHSSSEVCVVRGVTTRSTTNSVQDITWRELTTVLVIDDIIPAVRASLRRKFPRVKNTAQTRGAIRTQVLIELENKKQQEMIDDYGAVTAQTSESDPTVCIVSFDFTVAHGLNRIELTAHISV